MEVAILALAIGVENSGFDANAARGVEERILGRCVGRRVGVSIRFLSYPYTYLLSAIFPRTRNDSPNALWHLVCSPLLLCPYATTLM
jgi:hypothetical protein